MNCKHDHIHYILKTEMTLYSMWMNYLLYNLELPHRQWMWYFVDPLNILYSKWLYHKICLGYSNIQLCSLTYSLSMEECQSLHLGWEKVVPCSHSQILLSLDIFLKTYIFPLNFTIFTVVKQKIRNLNKQGFTCAPECPLNSKTWYTNVLLYRFDWMWWALQLHDINPLTSLNNWPINYCSTWGWRLERWLHFSTQHMTILCVIVSALWLV